MSEHKAISELQDTLVDVIDAHIEQNVLSLAEVLGTLEIIKLNVYIRNIEDEDED